MATDYYQLRVQGLHETERNECVLHFRGTNLTAADYLANADDLVQAWNSDINALWMALLPDTYQCLRLTAKKASVGGGGEVSLQYDMGANQGAVGVPAASQQLCPVVTLIPPMGIKTAGKIFLPCIPESLIGANVVNSTWLASLATLMTALMTGFSFSSITWDLVIFSRKNSSFAEVVDYSTSPIVGFQRRRQRSYL